MKVPLLDLKLQYKTIRKEVLEATEEIYESQYFILGPKVEGLEREIAAYCGVNHSVGVSSGTDALIISLMVAGVGPGDLVLTTPYTFFATAGSIARLGARPVFADIDPDTYNLSPDELEKIILDMKEADREKIKAIIPVHLYGQCADMDAILEIAQKYQIVVIEDAAQAIGSEYKGRRAGSMGDFGCFSFFPSKNLGAFGDGGIVTTGSDEIRDQLHILRVHGSHPKYFHNSVGGNFRLDALQAAIISIKLKYLDGWTEARARNALAYRELFEAAGLLDRVNLPIEKEVRHIYNQFVISVGENRDDLRLFLDNEGIGAEIYYPVPLHLQECFAYLDQGVGTCPEAEKAAGEVMALPVYPELINEMQDHVVNTILDFLS